MTEGGGRADERRLDELRREAHATGKVEGAGVVARGGPLPVALAGGGGAARATSGASGGGVHAAPNGGPDPARAPLAGYYGRPVLKPAPWTWEVPLYLFAGGVAGCSAVLALAARVGGSGGAIPDTALRIAVGGVAASTALLVSDLGRPARFLYMLRVFKPRSPMSLGAWLLTAFGGAAAAALALGAGDVGSDAGVLAWGALVVAALLGALLATYTGVLLSATVVPAWNSHAGLLPLHFGAAALGSAAALLELLVAPVEALGRIGLVAAAAETGAWLWTEVRTNGARDRALRSGRPGRMVRASALLCGPAALALRLAGLPSLAAAAFLIGALLGRFGWLEAGRASTADPEAAL
jgi:formate-dependent nitrite reductase membrane component NrfD